MNALGLMPLLDIRVSTLLEILQCRLAERCGKLWKISFQPFLRFNPRASLCGNQGERNTVSTLLEIQPINSITVNDDGWWVWFQPFLRFNPTWDRQNNILACANHFNPS